MSRKADELRRKKELESSVVCVDGADVDSPETDDEFTEAVDEYLEKQGFKKKVEDNSKDIQELKEKDEEKSKDIQELKEKVEENSKDIQEFKKKEDNSTTFFKINEASTASENTSVKSVYGTEVLLASGTIQRTFKLVFAAGNYYSENKAAVEQATGEKAVLKYIWTDSKEFLTADDLEHLGIIDNTQG